jgi:hypothetical protein
MLTMLLPLFYSVSYFECWLECRYELYTVPRDSEDSACDELVLFSHISVSFLYSQYLFYIRRSPAILPMMLWGDYPFPCVDSMGRSVATVYPYIGWRLVRCFELLSGVPFYLLPRGCLRARGEV